MNSSEIEFLTPWAYNYLGFHGVSASPETDLLIAESFKELESLSRFRYIFMTFSSPPEFLNKEPYSDYLKDSEGVIISAMTLGIEVDRKINRLFRTDMPKAVVLDACASAYLEFLSDMKEKTLGDNLATRFCPGYGGSDVSDLREIFKILHPEKIGITLTPTDFMLPLKSMAGMIAIGKSVKKSCKGCFMAKTCNYLKEGKRCYNSEK